MTHEQRLDRLEVVVHVLAEDQLVLQELIAKASKDTSEGFDRVARQFVEVKELFKETDRRIQEMNRKTDERFRETDARMQEMNRRLDERIENLVSAIGK